MAVLLSSRMWPARLVYEANYATATIASQKELCVVLDDVKKMKAVDKNTNHECSDKIVAIEFD